MNAVPSPHPTGDRLHAFAQGRLLESDLTLVEAHLETCPECCRLLESLSQDDTFLSHFRSLDGKSSNHALPTAPPKVAGYEMLEELGRGGMGVVYRARQQGANRLVALKVMLAGAHASRDERTRFRSEAEAVARVRHPNVVQVYEVGEQDGLLFFSMELVEGGSLADEDQTPLPAREAAALLEPLTRGVAAAHEQGIVHRDLKPANILMSSELGVLSSELRKSLSPLDNSKLKTQNSKLFPKVTDFGLAKWVGREAGLTRTGLVAGTPSYMAPEQARGDKAEVGPAADVWALGAVLYKVLTGRAPFHGPTALDTLAMVATQEPVPPRQLQPAVPRDLETICLKCLHKDPRHRYATAGDLADDLRRFLDDEPIRARPVGVGERGWRWARRRPAAAAAVAVSVLAALALLGGWLHFTQRLSEERWTAIWEKDEADKQRREADKARVEADDARATADKARRRAEEGEAKLALQLDRARRTTLTMQLARVDAAYKQDPAQARVYLEDLHFCPEDLRDFSWGYYYRRCTRDRRTVARSDLAFWTMALSPDGQTLAAVEGQAFVRLVNLADGQPLARWKVHDANTAKVVWSPDGRLLATVGNTDAVVKLWDPRTGQLQATLQGHKAGVWGLAFSPDSQTLATGSLDKTVRLWDVAEKKSRAVLTGHNGLIMAAAFAPDGQSLATVSEDKSVRLWDVAAGKEVAKLEGHEAPIEAVAWTPDGKTVISGSWDRTIRLWDPAAARQALVVKGHSEPVVSVAVTPDGRTLISGSWDKTIRLWNLPDGKEREVLRGHADRLLQVAATPDGRSMLSLSYDMTTRLWDLAAEPAELSLRGHGHGLLGVAVSPNGGTVATASMDQSVRLWDMASGKEQKVLHGHKGPVWCVKWSPDGRALATGSEEGMVRLWNAATGEPGAVLSGHQRDVMCVAFSPDGRTLASGGQDQVVRLWDLATEQLRLTLKGHGGVVWSVAFTPDGQTLATGSEDGTARLWDAATGEPREVFLKDVGRVFAVAFAPDGKTLATGGGDKLIRLWDVDGLAVRERLTLQGHSNWVKSLAFTDDGRTLVSGSFDGKVKLWEVVTGQQRLSLAGDSLGVMAVAAAPDGSALLCGGGERILRLWRRAAPPRP